MYNNARYVQRLRACWGQRGAGCLRGSSGRLAASCTRRSWHLNAEVNSWRMPEFNQSTEQPSPAEPRVPEVAVVQPDVIDADEHAASAEEAHVTADAHPPPDCPSDPPTPEPAVPPTKKNKKFNQRMQELTTFHTEHGHCRVPLNTGLGGWITYQRRLWKAGKLPLDHYHALAALGFEFDHFAARWSDRFSQLSRFHSQYGHCTIPADAATESRWPGLRQWTLVQRQAWKRGLLADDRVRRLSGLGFVWRPAEERWEERFAELAAFKQAYGHCNVPKGWPLNQGLASWVENIRTRWRARHGARPLTHCQEQRLRELGFEFEPHRRSWEERYSQLLRVKQEAGHLGGPFPSQGRWAGLGEWVVQQRHKGRTGRLHPHRYQALQALGFVWDLEEAAWDGQLAALDALIERVGTQMALDMLEGPTPATVRLQRRQQQEGAVEAAAAAAEAAPQGPAGSQPEPGPRREAKDRGDLPLQSLAARAAPTAAMEALRVGKRPPTTDVAVAGGLAGEGAGGGGSSPLLSDSQFGVQTGAYTGGDDGPSTRSTGSLQRRRGVRDEPAGDVVWGDDGLGAALSSSWTRGSGGVVGAVAQQGQLQQGQLQEIVSLRELLRWFRTMRRQADAGELRPDRVVKLKQRGLRIP